MPCRRAYNGPGGEASRIPFRSAASSPRRQAPGGERAAQAFRDDLALCARYGASGFPTILFRSPDAEPGDEDAPGVLVGGHRSLATYERVLARVAPGLRRHEPRALDVLVAEHGPLTTREVSEILGLDMGAAERRLREAEATRSLVSAEQRGGAIWAAPGDTTVHPTDNPLKPPLAASENPS